MPQTPSNTTVLAIVIASFSIALTAAQASESTQAEDMRLMMQKMAELQVCIAKIDRAALQQLEQRSNSFQQQLKRLCAEKKLAQAQREAAIFGTEVMQSPPMLELKACAKELEGAIPAPTNIPDWAKELEGRHICDEAMRQAR